MLRLEPEGTLSAALRGDSARLGKGLHVKNNATGVQVKVCTHTFTAPCLTGAEKQKQSR